jgi:hypothetical protein
MLEKFKQFELKEKSRFVYGGSEDSSDETTFPRLKFRGIRQQATDPMTDS